MNQPSPYTPPLAEPGSPNTPYSPVWPWYCAFAIFMAVLYLAIVALGVVFVITPDWLGASPSEKLEFQIQGGLMAVFCLPFALAFGAAPLLPKKPWAWIYHLILIAICLSSCACALFCIPLLMHWMTPQTKAMFGRT